MRKKYRMNLQLFAEPTGGAGGTEPPAGGQGQQTQPSSAGGQPAPPQIDYTKIQQMLEGTLAAQQAMLDKEATLAAISLGLDAKTIPYVLKMADLSQAIGQDGKVNTEALNTALNKVLEDVPALKPQASGTTGFVQVGAASTGQQTSNEPMTLKDAISAALKK